MAYVNVAEWSPDQVGEWLRGLDDVIHPYIHYFVENKVDGKRLLHLSSIDFPNLNVTCIGHQAIILQAVELLRNIHYHLHQENIQHLALRLSSKSRSVYNELKIQAPSLEILNGSSSIEEDNKDEVEETKNGSVTNSQKKKKVSTRILFGVVDVLSAVKSLVSWLHRTPFNGVEEYDNLKSALVDVSIGLATIAQREFAFAENTASVIQERCFLLAEMADKIIQEYKDPLILQPASLDVVTIKKRADDTWGLNLVSSYHGIHQISMIRALSPAHTCGKLMGDDQLVQVHYQTVVGWTSHKVTELMQENPCEVILTVKKCPRHDTNNLTKIYFKPIRLPSKKRTYSPWTNKVLSPTKYDLQSIPNLEFINRTFDCRSAARRVVSTEPHPKSITPPVQDNSSGGGTVLNSSASDIGGQSASESDDGSEFEDDAFLSDGDVGGSSSLNVRLFQPKPRPPVQRRATIPGATARPNFSFDHMIQGFCPNQFFTPICKPDLPFIRAKDSPESIKRPHTCIGTEQKSCSPDSTVDLPFIDECDEKEDEKKTTSDLRNLSDIEPPRIVVSDDRRFIPSVSVIEVDVDGSPKESTKLYSPPNSPVEGERCRKISDDRPKLDKSYSSPTYDFDTDEPPDFFLGKKPVQQKTPPNKSVVATPSESTKENDVEELKEGSIVTSSVKKIPPLLPISKSSLPEPESLFKEFSSPLTECPPTATSISPVVSLAFSALPLSTVPSVSDFKNIYGVTRGNIPLSGETNTQFGSPTNSLTIDNSSYILMSGADPTNSEDLSNHGRKDGYEALKATVTQDPSTPKYNGDHSHGVLLRKSQSRSPVSWRRGLLVPGTGSRRISCRELGQGDHHGWLYRRKESKGFLMSHRWEKRWFVLKKSDLYGYRGKESTKADSYIYLPGFYVCPAPDIKSKRFAFKIYHSSGATFYFACDTAEERSRWMSQMGLSAISTTGPSVKESNNLNVPTEEAYYSETDDELDDKSPVMSRAFSPPARTPSKKDGNKGNCRALNNRTPLSSLGGGKSSGIRFLHASKPSLGQPVPTSNFRSYVRVRDTPTRRSTSTSDLLTPENSTRNLETESTPQRETPKAAKPVRRKDSLRERLKQIPASLTLDKRKDKALSALENANSVCAPSNIYHTSKSESSLIEKEKLDGPSNMNSSISGPNLPNYMRPTRASSQNVQDASYKRSVACSPTPPSCPKPSGVSRRGSIGGLSSSNNSTGSLSPRRGSLDCLSSGTASPPPGGVKSNASLLSNEEYQGGSPEKNWISSLRTDGGVRSRPTTASVNRQLPSDKKSLSNMPRRSSTDEGINERLKRTNQYHPLFLKKNENMKPAFEMNLTEAENEMNENSEMERNYNRNIKPEVPPRTKFLSPSERILSPPHTQAPVSPFTPQNQNSPSGDIISERASRSKAPPNLTISPATEDTDGPKTPLKPTMGVAMIGKQRRTPGVVSPREVFFSSPPHSPKSSPSLFSSPYTPSPNSSYFLSPSDSFSKHRGGIGVKIDKILPHYPGTEYPPTFEPESYTINLSNDQSVMSHSRPKVSPIPSISPRTNRMTPPQISPYGLNHYSLQRKTSRTQVQLTRSVSTSQSFSSSNRGSPHTPPNYCTTPRSSEKRQHSPLSSNTPLKRSYQSQVQMTLEAPQVDKIQNRTLNTSSPSTLMQSSPLDNEDPDSSGRSPSAIGYINISHVSSTLQEHASKSYHHNIYVTSPCSETSTQTSNSANGSQVLDPNGENSPNFFQTHAYLPMDKMKAHIYMNVSPNVKNHSGDGVWKKSQDDANV